MPPVTIYTKPLCPYCHRALSLLGQKGVKYEEIEAAWDPDKKREMMQRAGGRSTFPQIFIGDKHIGGSDELSALDRSGELDTLLAG